VEIQARRPAFDAAEQEMPHRIEADGVHPQSVIDGISHFFQSEGLQQAEDLDVLAASVLVQAQFQQPPQMR
jgi:hypothetical protein